MSKVRPEQWRELLIAVDLDGGGMLWEDQDLLL